MNPQAIKSHLLQRRHELLSRYHGELERAAEELDSRESEQVENATELWDARVLSRLGDADAAALGQIVGALRRIEDGSYGACDECCLAIEAERLTVLPEATTCIYCARDLEANTSPSRGTRTQSSPRAVHH